MTSPMRLRLIEAEEAPPAAPDDGPAVRVAVTTQDMKSLNAHFGSARRFALYDVTRTSWRFVEALSFDNVSSEEGKHASDQDDRITPKVNALKGCKLLFCLAIGGPSAAKVVSAGIHPIKIAAPTPIDDVLERTRVMLNGAPPPWLRKALGDASPTPRPAFADD